MSDEAEEWRPVPGTVLYASNLGRLRGPNKVRKPQAGTGAYTKVRVKVWGNLRTLWIHRLIASAWHVPTEGQTQVNHRDGNPGNNRPDNLEWVTPSENCRHSSRMLRRARGSSRGHSKLKEGQIPDIRMRLAAGETLNSVGRDYGVSASTVHAIRTGRTWAHV